MPRSRIIKPEFFKHAGLYDAEARSGLPLRLAFEGLWCVADRAGRFQWKPRELTIRLLKDCIQRLIALIRSPSNRFSKLDP